MSVLIKSIAKKLPHPLLLRLHHYYDLKRKSALAHAASKLTNLPLLETLELGSVKTSDTVFVLGSGWSINEIPNARWEVIGRHDSIAMNFWPLHAFVPRVYLFENVKRIEGWESIFDELQRLLQRRAQDYRNTIKIISEELQLFAPRQLVFEVPENFRRNLYIGFSSAVVARTEAELVAGLRYLRRQGLFAPGTHIPWLFKYQGSVIGVLSLAARMGYRRIILCGIDLGKAEYFYHHRERYPETSRWEFVPRDQPHLMARRYAWGLPSQTVIEYFRREVLDPAGIELFVENRSSTLFPLIGEVPPQLFSQLARAPCRM
jgi:hypothetical protein